MKKLRLLPALCLASLLFSTNVIAADGLTAGQAVSYTLPAMAIVGVTGENIAMTFSAPTVAGETVVAPASNASTSLNYTSIIAASVNKISVALSAPMPASTILTVTAAADAAGGDGAVGTSGLVPVTLSTTSKDIITAIGSCYTGTGTAAGHKLTYVWSVDPTAEAFAALRANTSTDVTVTYTITSN